MTTGEATKSDLRKRLRQFLGGLPPEQIRERSRQIAGQVLNLVEYQRAGLVMAFLSLPAEVDTTAILENCWQGRKRVAVPRTDLERRDMVAVAIADLSGLVVNRYGLREPALGEPVTPGEIDLVLVPGLGFDIRGGRLGRGGGYYDRFLANLSGRACKCGLAFAEQVVEQVPMTGQDIRLDMLVTETGVRRFT